MLEGALRALVVALAIGGGLALVNRAGRAGARLVLRAAEVTAVSGMAEIRARRGDLTGLAESRELERRARRRRRRDGLQALLWALWLVLPVIAGWLPAAYAVAAPLWLLPAPPVKEGEEGREGEGGVREVQRR